MWIRMRVVAFLSKIIVGLDAFTPFLFAWTCHLMLYLPKHISTTPRIVARYYLLLILPCEIIIVIVIGTLLCVCDASSLSIFGTYNIRLYWVLAAMSIIYKFRLIILQLVVYIQIYGVELFATILWIWNQLAPMLYPVTLATRIVYPWQALLLLLCQMIDHLILVVWTKSHKLLILCCISAPVNHPGLLVELLTWINLIPIHFVITDNVHILMGCLVPVDLYLGWYASSIVHWWIWMAPVSVFLHFYVLIYFLHFSNFRLNYNTKSIRL